MPSSALPLLLSVSPALLLLLQLPVNLQAQEVLLQDNKYGRPQWDGTSCSWRCLLLTLQWPAAFCQVSVSLRGNGRAEAEVKLSLLLLLQLLDEGRLCQIPQSVNRWTIHGLW